MAPASGLTQPSASATIVPNCTSTAVLRLATKMPLATVLISSIMSRSSS